MSKQLVGCISSLRQTIKTRYFFVDTEKEVVQDVTVELSQAIDKFNAVADKIRESGTYSMRIPYRLKDGMVVYSFGCGLSHYLQENTFSTIVERNGESLSFPLQECRISMYTPDDVRHILGCKGVFDINIQEALAQRYFKVLTV